MLANSGQKGGNGRPGSNNETTQHVEELSRMNLLSVFVLLPADYEFLLR